MKCLCQASSYCNLTAPCTTGSQYLCGPFLIGVNYWADAGQPTLLPDDDPNATGGKKYSRSKINKGLKLIEIMTFILKSI